MEFTHDELLEPSEALLKRSGKKWKCHSTFVELVTAGIETPDVFGFASGKTSLAEVKVSRSDFLADKNKFFRIYPEQGMGNYRFYVCPEELISVNELPENWGLGYYDGKRVKVIVQPKFQDSNRMYEICFAASVMRRIKADEKIKKLWATK